MFALLSWLWSRAERVYLFFGTLYQSIVDAARYAYQWAKEQATKAYNAALIVINILLKALEILLRRLIDLAVGVAVDIAKNAIRIAIEAFQAVETWYNEKIKPALDALNAAILDAVSGLIVWTLQQITGVLETVKDLINQTWSMLLKYIFVDTPIGGLIAFFTGDVLEKIRYFLDRMFNFLYMFIDRPLGFIMELIKSVFLVFLEYTFAYALGTTKYDLPPWPSWDEMEGGYTNPPPLPVGAGKLRAPVSPLWISGYRYLSHPRHFGLDLGLDEGQNVFASHDGIVEEAGWSGVGYGFTVTLRSGTWWTRYAHLSSVRVTRNQRVDSGQVVGLGGCTGASTCNHLHFEVKYKGQFVDPVSVLPL